MKLHFFNPEHDIALATDVKRFTAPSAARQLRHDLGFLPALWADDGDFVLVEDVDEAVRQSKSFGTLMAAVRFVSEDDLRRWVRAEKSLKNLEIEPWGWDWGVVETLTKAGLADFCPSEEQFQTIRRLSNRKWAAETLLPALRTRISWPTVGVSRYISDENDLDFDEILHNENAFESVSKIVLKSPWSSSGRGIRYAFNATQFARNLSWARRVVEQQGGVMVEPFYEKIADFAMEFDAKADGSIVYKGLSLFVTSNGAYTGNLIASEREKRKILSEFVPEKVVEELREAIVELLKTALQGRYSGPFGIDMMVVRNESKNRGEKMEFALHPCVELNLRRTMGHAALAIPCDETTPARLMRIDYTDRHRLTIVSADRNPRFPSSAVQSAYSSPN